MVTMNPVDFCRALADDTRQAILQLLLERGELCVSDIVAAFNKSQPTISHHLNILQTTGLLHTRREGKLVYYAVTRENLTECCGMLWSKFALEREPIALTETAPA
ncbi:MAG: metalloregulator ArsR/SmtB family transcription factor [Anaerolineae bacterium]|nr:metalloregulator ArsR/SmtB family transcription factor [Anaerolineae bacterium]